LSPGQELACHAFALVRAGARRGEETDLLAPAVGFRSFYLVRYGTDGVGKVNLS
jgi:hypothetical protein